MTDFVDDYLAPELEIISRLSQKVQPEYRVISAQDLAGVTELSYLDKTLFVMYGGESSVEPKGGGVVSLITQLWYVVVNVRNVREMTTGRSVRAEVGPLLANVIGDMIGWSPAAGWTAFRQVRSPQPVTYRQGLMQYPLCFSTTCQVRNHDD